MKSSWKIPGILIIGLTACVAGAQTTTKTVSAGNGTLSFTVTTQEEQCELGPGRATYDTGNYFSNFSYTQNGVTTALPNMSADDESGPVGGSCQPDPPDNGTGTTSSFPLHSFPLDQRVLPA